MENADDTVNNTTDFTSHCYLLQNENPRAMIVSNKLNGENYHHWSRDVMVALSSKNKERFVDGTLPRPHVTDQNYKIWCRCNKLVLSWILLSLEPSIMQSVLWMETAREVWEDLKKRYYQGDIFRISELQEELWLYKQGDSSINAYYTHLRGIWQELDNLRPIPSCKCHTTCSCDLIPTIQSYRENDYVIRFLRGLNEQYSAVRSQIMLMEPLPNILTVFSMLIQKEIQLNTKFEELRIMSSTSEAGNQSRGSNLGGKPLCSYCNRIGHTVDTCYDFPPNFQKNASANYFVTEGQVEDHMKSVMSLRYKEDMGESSNMGFIPEQHQATLTMLQQSATNHSVNHIVTQPAENSVSCCYDDQLQQQQQHVMYSSLQEFATPTLPSSFLDGFVVPNYDNCCSLKIEELQQQLLLSEVSQHGTTCVDVECEKKSNERTISPQSAASKRRRIIAEKTRELGKLIPGGQKMNIAEMFHAAAKYVKFLEAQIEMLQLNNTLQEDKATPPSENLHALVVSPFVQEKLYTQEMCVVPKESVTTLTNLEDVQSSPTILEDLEQLIVTDTEKKAKQE